MGDPIDLYIIRPTGVVKPPVILYLYSYPSETDRFRDNDYCKRLVSGGYAAVGSVSALTGHRYHDRPMREWFVSEMPEALTKSVHDVQMVLQYLEKRGDVDMTRIGMFGAGSGATISILSSTVDSRIRAVDAIQPWGDWPDWLAKSSLIPEGERKDYLKPAFLANVAPFDPIKLAGDLKAKAIRVQFVLDDNVTPSSAARTMKAALPQTTEVLEFQTKQQQYELLRGGKTFSWLKDELRPTEVPEPNARALAGDPQNVTQRTH
jgi:hypothetical protein